MRNLEKYYFSGHGNMFSFQYTTEDLLDVIQASKEEIMSHLQILNACEIGGRRRTVPISDDRAGSQVGEGFGYLCPIACLLNPSWGSELSCWVCSGPRFQPTALQTNPDCNGLVWVSETGRRCKCGLALKPRQTSCFCLSSAGVPSPRPATTHRQVLGLGVFCFALSCSRQEYART